MKKLLVAMLCLVSMSAFAGKSCGVRETAASLATIDMELDLLSSGLYDQVRAASMRKIAGIIKAHIQSAQTCDATSESLKKSAIETIDQLVMNNQDYRDYSISTAQRIFRAIRSSVAQMDSIAASTLDDLIQNSNL